LALAGTLVSAALAVRPGDALDPDHERLAILASRKHGIPGRNWVSRFDGAWLSRLNVYRLSGRVRWVKAHA